MQQVAPPLTGIHTPNKGGNSVFAFGHRNITQENAVLPSFPSKGKLSGMITINKVQTFKAKIHALHQGLALHQQLYKIWGGGGGRDVAVVIAVASHQCGLGSIPGRGVIKLCGLSLLLVLILAPRGISLGTLVFPSPQKPTLLNSNLIWKVCPISALG